MLDTSCPSKDEGKNDCLDFVYYCSTRACMSICCIYDRTLSLQMRVPLSREVAVKGAGSEVSGEGDGETDTTGLSSSKKSREEGISDCNDPSGLIFKQHDAWNAAASLLAVVEVEQYLASL